MRKKITIGIVATCLVIGSLFIRKNISEANKLTIGIFTGSYWDVLEQDSFAVLDEAIAQFSEKYDVDIEYVTGIPQDQYEEWLGEKYLENDMPDLFFVPNELFSTYVSNGMLMNLDEWIVNDSSLHLSAYYSVSLDATQMNGHTYALPYASSPQLMLVNQDILNDFSLEMPEENWTWDDLLSSYRSVSSWLEDITFINDYTWELAAYCSDPFFFNEQDSTADFSSSDMIATVSFLRKIYEDPNSTLSSNPFENVTVLFQPVSYSTFKTYTSYPYSLQYAGTQWASTSLPAKESGVDFTPVDTLSIGIYQGTKQKDLAWLFLSYLSTDYEIQKELMMTSPCVSVLQEVLQDEELQDMFTQDEQKIDLSELDAIMNSGRSAYRSEKYTQVIEMAESSMNSLISNEQDIENNLIILNRKISEFLGQYYQ